MSAIDALKNKVSLAVRKLYDLEIDAADILLNPTRKEFEGEYTVVCFPFTKAARKKPDQIAEELGNELRENEASITGFNVVKGFLNLSLGDHFWMEALNGILAAEKYGWKEKSDQKIMIEFSSPNTNKPLHLGHIRNILLGWSSSKIYEALGYEVIKTQVINDRGIAICKSMLAWQKYGEGKTPESSGKKGDHLVGDFYVGFEQHFKEEYAAWQNTAEAKSLYENEKKGEQTEEEYFKAYKNKYFNEYSQLGAEAKEMLLKWEAGDPETLALWEKMNSWVYAGFDATYEKLGVHFDTLYHESKTYVLGKDSIEKGLKNGVFFKKEDGSVWIDLTDVKMDEKIVLRSDGTSVYMTQDIGTAQKRYADYEMSHMVYVVGDEQDYHFKVLFEILKRLEEPYADGLFHLSYGMIELPTGRMKSREGTIVDADDLVKEVISEAKASAEERSIPEDISAEEQEEITQKVGMAALKFMMLKVQAKKKMIFNPKESVDMQGQTGPYIQNAYVRIQSILRKSAGSENLKLPENYTLHEQEKELIIKLLDFPGILESAARDFDPSTLANFNYELARLYHRFYHDVRILSAETEEAKTFRLTLCQEVSKVLKNGMELLGIEMPERM